jgi:predicted ATP-dependent protease
LDEIHSEDADDDDEEEDKMPPLQQVPERKPSYEEIKDLINNSVAEVTEQASAEAEVEPWVCVSFRHIFAIVRALGFPSNDKYSKIGTN